MHHAEQIRQIELLLHRLDTGTTVDAGQVHLHDPSVYVDRELAAREWSAFFRGHPQMVGLSGDLPQPGSFFTIDDLGTPIIVSRGDDGRVRALVNACRHRGARVEHAERGTTRRFTCAFHRWTYAPDGSLAGVPKPDHFGEVDRSCHGLVELPAAEHHGLLLVHPDPDGVIDVDGLLGPELSAELANWRFDELQYLDRDHYDVACNWKLAMDTFGETYHFGALHEQTLFNGFHGNVQAYDTYGRHHRMLLVRRSIDDLRHVPQDQWHITVAALPVYWLFPNVQLMPFQDGCYLVRAYPVPGEPGRHVSRITFYIRPGVDELVDVQRNDMHRTIGQLFAGIIRDEDYVMAASQQRAANSGALQHVLFGRNEPALQHYHATYRSALDAAL